MQAKHIQNHAMFTSTFKAETIKEWTRDIETWNTDNRKPNLYEDKPLSKLDTDSFRNMPYITLD
jgi:hypothetical protein